jgi:hypothetical protein
MAFRRDESALGQVVALLAAGAVFFATVGALLLASNEAGTDANSANAAAKRVEARSLADVLVGSPGVGWAGGADHLSRLGLGATNGSGLQQSSMDALKGAVEQSQASNGKVDYDEALGSLGLDPAGDSGFHIRIYPLGSLHGATPKVAYIADWTSLVTVKVQSTDSNKAASANVQLNLTMAANTVKERQALRDAGARFTDRVYITTTTPTILVDYPGILPDLPLLTVLNVPLLEGDVYPDNKPYLESTIGGAGGVPTRLTRDRYDVLVVGSGVDHSTLNSNGIKTAVKNWVLAGGSLVVLGSDEKSTAWLNPLFNAGVATVNGAPTAPDVSHPILKEPWVLGWTAYATQGQAWDIQSGGGVAAYNDFSHIVLQGGDDALAASKQAAFGQGQVILTTYRARDIAVAQGQTEADHFMENMLSYSDRSRLYLDYGGTVPTDQPVSLAVRESWIWDPLYGQVPERIEVLAWGPVAGEDG